jgi:protein-S-isoprenylcysteine O-methyltransferase Ste14
MAGKPIKQQIPSILRMILVPALLVGAPFAGAGRLDWGRGWIYVAMYMVSGTAILAIGRHYNPSLVEARKKWLRCDTRRPDRVFLTAFVPLALAQPLIAGLDAERFRWSSMWPGFVYVGVALFALATVVVAWTMAVNPFAEPTVRIQKERGHTVITSGPYRIVRHPLYAGEILMVVAAPLVLGSVWALVLSGLMIVLFIARTSWEDQTLRRELPGYEEYAARTRYRLAPGLW